MGFVSAVVTAFLIVLAIALIIEQKSSSERNRQRALWDEADRREELEREERQAREREAQRAREPAASEVPKSKRETEQRLAELNQRLADVSEAYAVGTVTLEQMTLITARLKPQIAQAEEDLRRARDGYDPPDQVGTDS